MNQKMGRASVKLSEAVYVRASASVAGTREGKGPLGPFFDMVGEDDMFGAETWEDAESTLQKDTVYLALGKAGLKPEEVSFLFAGDLLGQSMASSFGLGEYQIPLFGVYGACSTCGEALALGSIVLAGGFAENILWCHLKPLCQCRKGVSFSIGIWQSAPPFCYLDGDRKRRLCAGQKSGERTFCPHTKDYGRQDCGLRS